MSVYFGLQKQWSLTKNALKKQLVKSVGAVAALMLLSLPAYGQRLDPVVLDAFLTDPLEAEPRDPLLPTFTIDRPLSPLELYDLEKSLYDFDQQAQELILTNQPTEAFELWIREVQLRRLFGLEAELEAMTRIGQQAWNAQRSNEIKLMAVRLERIWMAEKETATVERVETIATIAQILRARDLSTEVYQQRLAMATPDEEQLWLAVLADHYLQWFDFTQAADLYTDLAARAKTQENIIEQTLYLSNLIYSHQQSKNYAQVVPAQAELLGLYRITGQSDREPPLEIEMARNFRAMGVDSKAVEYYNLAYKTAQTLELYGHVSTVLKDLGDLYAARGMTNEALTMYNLLVRAEQQAYNQHGILEAYDRLGQLYLGIDDPDNALIAFRAGLAFSESLSYREVYFRGEVAKLSLAERSNGNGTPANAPNNAPVEAIGNTVPGESIRDNLRDNPPFDLEPVELEPADVEPAQVEPVEILPPNASPAVEVISDEMINTTEPPLSTDEVLENGE